LARPCRKLCLCTMGGRPLDASCPGAARRRGVGPASSSAGAPGLVGSGGSGTWRARRAREKPDEAFRTQSNGHNKIWRTNDGAACHDQDPPDERRVSADAGGVLWQRTGSARHAQMRLTSRTCKVLVTPSSLTMTRHLCPVSGATLDSHTLLAVIQFDHPSPLSNSSPHRFYVNY